MGAMMARYIDLDKCNQYRTNHGGYPDTFAFPPWTEFEDVAPVIHAHWINCRGNYVSMDANGSVDGECLCSACGDYLTASDEYSVRGFYCPNCGAKMDEVIY